MKYLGHFISSVIFFQIVPLTPLWYEYVHTQNIEMDSYILCVAMYCFSTGFSSKKIWLLSICFILALILIGMYKSFYSAHTPVFPLSNFITYSLCAVFVMHFIERFERHCINREPFFIFDFNKNSHI